MIIAQNLDLKNVFENQRTFFHTGKTLEIRDRKEVLKKLKTVLKANEDLLNEAIHKDLHKSPYETYATEIGLIHNEINLQLRNMKKWSRRKRVRTNIINIPGSSFIQPHPLGVSLILGAWNYPYQLNLVPAIDALSAGNTVVVKPSEIAPHTSSAIAQLINNHFPPELFTVVEGGIETASKLLELEWDKIFFTGSGRVGKIVMKAAAKHLTPVTLELGGKSPVLISDSVDLDLAAKRIIWGKFTNCGQTCIAPDYALVHESVLDKILVKFKEQMEVLYQMGRAEDEYGRIINEHHFDRLVSYLDQGQVYAGGNHNRDSLWIEPTILTDVNESAPVMTEEIFGPILPVIPFKLWDEAIEMVRSRPHPLAAYVFSNRKQEQEIATDQLQFGGMTINDTLQHISNSYLPFGGVGASGMGSYHGKWGFDAFSHYKSIQKKARWIDVPLRYPPYTARKKQLLKRILDL